MDYNCSKLTYSHIHKTIHRTIIVFLKKILTYSFFLFSVSFVNDEVAGVTFTEGTAPFPVSEEFSVSAGPVEGIYFGNGMNIAKAFDGQTIVIGTYGEESTTTGKAGGMRKAPKRGHIG